MISDFIRLLKGFVLFIGPKEAGKTTILRFLTTGRFVETDPTMVIAEEYVSNVRVIEIGGHDSFRKYWKETLNQKPAHTFFVIDISKDSDYQEYIKFVEMLSDQTQLSSITLIANKRDLINEAPANLQINSNLIITSAKTGLGMMDILEEIAFYQQNTKIDNNRKLPDLEEISEDENEFDKIKKLQEEFEGKF